jgi:UTP--glucose-1-phosphate uridylyltransferase
LIVSGLRAGSYLCFFGMHVLTPSVMEILGRMVLEQPSSITLAAALGELAQREQYLALEQEDWRYDIGVKYGLFMAQLALALNGAERNEVLSRMVDLMAQRELRDRKERP